MLRQRERTDYEENAARIGVLLEEKLPALRRAGQGCDFRPDGHAERICSGVMFRNTGLCTDPGVAPVDENGPIEFMVTYGGEDLCRAGGLQLASIGIKPRVQLPGNRDGYRTMTWRVTFTLPQDYGIA